METEMFQMKMYFGEKLKQQKLNNTQAPSFDYENHAGGKTKLEDLRGKYVYIDVWATWCGPCRAEIPSLQKIEEKYHDKKIAFVSISVDEQKDYEKWKKFVVEKQLGGIQLYADKNWMSDFIKAFGINSIPRFILIDPTGKVVNADADRPSNPKLQEQLDALLK
jgi:thiol-disulfide isomerase/thioredoxin